MSMRDRLEEAGVEYVPEPAVEYERVEPGAAFLAPVGHHGQFVLAVVRRTFKRAVEVQTLEGLRYNRRQAVVVEWSARVYSEDAGVFYHVPQFAVVDADRLRQVPEEDR